MHVQNGMAVIAQQNEQETETETEWWSPGFLLFHTSIQPELHFFKSSQKCSSRKCHHLDGGFFLCRLELWFLAYSTCLLHHIQPCIPRNSDDESLQKNFLFLFLLLICWVLYWFFGCLVLPGVRLLRWQKLTVVNPEVVNRICHHGIWFIINSSSVDSWHWRCYCWLLLH